MTTAASTRGFKAASKLQRHRPCFWWFPPTVLWHRQEAHVCRHRSIQKFSVPLHWIQSRPDLTSPGCDKKTPKTSDFESDPGLLFSIPTYVRLDRKHCHLPILPVLWYNRKNDKLIARFHCKSSFPNHSNAHSVGLCCFLMFAFVSAGALNPPRALPNVQLFPYKAGG